MLEISHSHEDGTLVSGTVRGDGSGEVLKACGWRWSRNLGSWYVRRSRDRDADMPVIERTVARLREAGFEVSVAVDDSRRCRAEVEADQAERARARAQALAAKADRRTVQAQRAHEVADRASAAVPPGGEPIKVGHHSERRHRRSIERAQATLGAAVGADREATEARRRAAAAQAATDHRNAPLVVANRIDRLEAEERKVRRRIDSGQPTGRYLEQLHRTLEGLVDDVRYWKSVREQQVAHGAVAVFGPEDVEVGGAVVLRGQSLYRVVRVNAKTVTAASGPCTSRVRYHQIQRVLSRQQVEQTEAATKAP